MNKNKYAFRVYKFDDAGNIYSPIISDDSDSLGVRARLGETQVDDINKVRNEDFRGNIKHSGLWHNGKVHNLTPRHYGYSILGKSDPRYSIFNFFEDYFQTDDVHHAIEEEVDKYARNVPESLKEKDDFIKDFLQNKKRPVNRDFIKNDYDLFTHERSPLITSEKIDYLEKLHNSGAYPASHFTLPRNHSFFKDNDKLLDYFVDMATIFTGNDADDDDDYDDYDEDMFEQMGTKMGDNMGIVLVSVPEDKMLSVDDVIKNKFTAQRDFPEELIATEVTPLRIFNEFPKAVDNYKKLRWRDKVPAAEAFGESFKIEPGDFVSDKQLKDIYLDMCRVNDCRKNKQRQHANIVNAIRELGQ